MPWHFRQRYHRLEVVPSLEWDNAHSGYGFIETGVEVSESGVFQHYSENFDVLGPRARSQYFVFRSRNPGRGAAERGVSGV